MNQDTPIPYAWAPTRSGQKIPHSLGSQSQRVVISFDKENCSSTTTTTSTPTSNSDTNTPQRSASAPQQFVFPTVDAEAPIPHRQPGDMYPDAEHIQRRPNALLCTCGNCERMPRELENKCCQQEPLDHTHLLDYTPGKCLLECEAIQHAIGRVSIQFAWLRRRRSFGHTGEALAFTNMTNANYRHHAYRCYVDYIYGLLGRRNRKVIPACIVRKIRSDWPDPDGNYRGFQLVDEAEHPIDMDELTGL